MVRPPHPRAVLGRFDTATVPLAQRRRLWAAATARFLVPLDIRSASETVAGTIDARRTSGVTVCRLAATAHVAVRTAALAPGPGSGHLKVALPLRGRTTIIQGPHRTTLGPGELCLYDTSRPYTVGSDAPFELAIALLPRDAVAVSDTELERLAARRLHGSGVAEVRAGLLKALSQTLHEDERDLIYDRLALLAPAGVDRDRGPRSRAALRDAAGELINRRLGSPRLTPEYIAEVLGVSRRTLYAAFEADGRSVAGTIRHARLERARDVLCRAEYAGASISEVAASCGFSSLAHFSKLFRAEFGQPPSTFRRAQV